MTTINPGIIRADYAVRGTLARLAEEIRNKIASGNYKYPFEKVVPANLGNPQGCGQLPITFPRQVLSLMEYPALLESKISDLQKLFPSDAIARARWLTKHIGSIGSYSSNQGIKQIRESIAEFITIRDGYPSFAEDIYLTCGAFEGMLITLMMISGGNLRGEKTGVLLPVPHYPVYLALLSLFGLENVPYYLEEENEWGAPSASHTKSLLHSVREQGIRPRLIVVINPNNPTGSTLKRSQIEEILRLAAEEKLLILADEVYQPNVFPPSEYFSCKSVLRDFQATHPSDSGIASLQLVSLHSVSKGMYGEGGQRGGYFEAVGFPEDIKFQLTKLVTFTLQPTTPGQILVECMVNPPKPCDPSYDCYRSENDAVFAALKSKADALFAAFNRMPGVVCQRPQGAMYLFPRVNLPAQAVQAARKTGEKPDIWYCMKLLQATGVCVVPGSGFGMGERNENERAVWFRVTFLAQGEDWIRRIEDFQKRFMEEYA